MEAVWESVEDLCGCSLDVEFCCLDDEPGRGGLDPWLVGSVHPDGEREGGEGEDGHDCGCAD